MTGHWEMMGIKTKKLLSHLQSMVFHQSLSQNWKTAAEKGLSETRVRALIITADHGNDPTYTGADHTREYDANIEVMNPNNNQKGRQKEQIESVRKQETELNLWTKLAGLSGEYQSLVVMRMSVILLRLMYLDLILPM